MRFKNVGRMCVGIHIGMPAKVIQKTAKAGLVFKHDELWSWTLVQMQCFREMIAREQLKSERIYVFFVGLSVAVKTQSH